MTAIIGFLLDAIPGELWVALGAVFAAGLSWFVGRKAGVRATRNKAVEKRLNEYKATHERMENADTSGGDDAEWLHNRGKR